MRILYSRFGDGKVHQATQNGERGACNPGRPWSLLKYTVMDGKASDLTCATCRKMAGLEPLEVVVNASEKDEALLETWKWW